MGMHDSERCLSLCCLQAPPLPRLGRDSEHEERGDAPGTVAAPAGNGAGEAGASPAWTIFGFGAFTGPASAPWHSMGSAHMLGPPVDVGQRTKEKDVKNHGHFYGFANTTIRMALK